MSTLPRIHPGKYVNESPHVVILGAGASRAAFPRGDRNGRKLPLMQDFVEIVGLHDVLDRAGVCHRGVNFEELYERLAAKKPDSLFLEEIRQRIRNYFSLLELPGQVTIYDKLLLGLRAKDFIASFNWDPLLLLAYRRNSRLKELPRIAFLHGCVSTGICEACRVKGILTERCAICGIPFKPVDLLYPIREKGYRDSPFIANEWRELEFYLESAYLLTVFGYSAPRTDVEAREILRKVWDRNATKELAQVKIINTARPSVPT